MILATLTLLLANPATADINAPPQALKDRLNLSPFYKKHIDANGFPILGSEKVPDKAFLEARRVVNAMLSKTPKAIDQMVKNKVRLVIMAEKEVTLDVPEHNFLKDDKNTDWNARARGLGATKRVPVVSCAEENVLAYPTDRYNGESILIHEFAHAIMDTGLVDLDPTFRPTLQKLYDDAKAKGLWENTYAMTNIHEYWAEAVQCWFDTNRTASPPNGVHNHVGDRKTFQAYDPEMAKFVAKYMPKDWTYTPPAPAWKKTD